MKSLLRVTCLGGWALLVGCSAKAPAPAGDDGRSTLNEALLAPDAPRSGGPTNPCAAVLCAPDTTCEVVDGDAVCTPFDPGNAPGSGSAPFCGGIAAIQCPGAGTCVDDPSDGCDLDNGGADCGGVCECNALALCIEGNVFDDSPDICACVPAEPEPGSGPFCGGIAGIACPGGGTCVDDPADDCDPDNGGADCGGNCACQILAVCIEGNVFDASPDVCACVPAEPELDPCAAVRCAAGTHCEVVGEGAICALDEPVDPCAAVSCAIGKHCVARGVKARCLPARRGHDCRRDD